jgi:hypothetical protein
MSTQKRLTIFRQVAFYTNFLAINNAKHISVSPKR